ncbi:MAG: ferrous iron transport protein A [Clostridia bacterium]|nr:ferrous iron transport protein A [Clostridia bacterium]
MKLSQLSIGERARIKDVNAPIFLRRRIFELGCAPNVVIEVLSQRKAGGGVYSIAGVMLGIRKNITQLILVEKL